MQIDSHAHTYTYEHGSTQSWKHTVMHRHLQKHIHTHTLSLHTLTHPSLTPHTHITSLSHSTHTHITLSLHTLTSLSHSTHTHITSLSHSLTHSTRFLSLTSSLQNKHSIIVTHTHT